MVKLNCDRAANSQGALGLGWLFALTLHWILAKRPRSDRTCSKLLLGRQCSHAWCSSLHPRAILTEELSGELSAVKDFQQLAKREGSIKQSLHSRMPLGIWLKWQMAGLQLEMTPFTSFLSRFLHTFPTLSGSTSLINHLCRNSYLKICFWQITGKRMSTIWLNSILLPLLPNISP